MKERLFLFHSQEQLIPSHHKPRDSTAGESSNSTHCDEDVQTVHENCRFHRRLCLAAGGRDDGTFF